MNRQQQLIQVAMLVAISVCALAPTTVAAGCPELVGSSPGFFYVVAVLGDYAYIGSRSTFTVADVADPSAARIVGNIGIPGGISGVAVSGGYAYVVAGNGLRVIDVSDPATPVEVGFVDTPGTTEGVAVSGDQVYVAAREAGLRVIDVSTPSAPVEVGFLDTVSAWHVAVSGGYAYVVATNGLSVIDVSTPSAPVEVGFWSVYWTTGGIAVSGEFAYVAVVGYGLKVFNVGTPTAPRRISQLEIPGSTVAVAVSGSHVYLAGHHGLFGSLRVIDVSTPLEPVEVGILYTPEGACDVALSGGIAYLVLAKSAGLFVIDVSTPSAPVEVGSVDTLGETRAVAASRGYAHFAGDAGFSVTDVSTPSAPVEVGSLDTRGSAWGVTAVGGRAYVAWGNQVSGEGGLGVIDVHTPSTPVEIGFLGSPYPADALAVTGDFAYVTSHRGGYPTTGNLQVIDVSLPFAPEELGSASVAWTATGIAVSGNYVYVSTGDAGDLRVIDVSTPSAPVEVGSVDVGDYTSDVAVSGGYAFVTWVDHLYGQSGGLRVIDVSTPSAPVEVGSVDIGEYATAVAVSGGYAYVMAGGLRVIDVSRPSAPIEVCSLETPASSILGVAVSDGYVYGAAYTAGMYVFSECSRPAQDARVSFIPAAAVAAGAEGAFFSTDIEVNNTGTDEAQVTFQWLPRGEDNSEPIESVPIALAPGRSLRWENVLTRLFGLVPDSVGALKLVASRPSVIGMSRTYNSPEGKAAGTFGQGLPAIRATEMISGTEARRIIFLSEGPGFRANVGCVNGLREPVRINMGIFDDEGTYLETKAMDLRPWSNDQINRIFQDYAPVNGYVDVRADDVYAVYYCYGSMLDMGTSDPTTILPQVPSADTTFIPAAALAAGLEGAFFRTDLGLNNFGLTDVTYELLWLPRGADNPDPIRSEPFSLAPGAGVRYANVLDEVFGLEPDQVGALAVEASGIDLLAMSRTYNLPSAKVAGTFGQELPGIPADRMIPSGVKKRIIFMSENDDVRANVGCVNGVGTEVAVQIELYDSDGVKLETKYMMLPPFSNRQINGIFQDYAPINGYVDVRTHTPDAVIYCYGSVLDNLTSDPTTVLPQ